MEADLLPSVEMALIEWFTPPLNNVGKHQVEAIDSICKIEIRLKNVRESRELSQYDLAKLAGMSPQNIQKLEQGRAKGIQLDTLDALCQALKCEVNDLLVRVSS
ncbi:helix-turn-helix transcriptional regulator [Pseudanabaena sp. 'Roaring Creek']|uniref:helix-turn-helix domain-containing protein n=1 Tax=Pseudanabaena sp. 'Roaring Creek' TaxID=1681830 RepID=UPI000AD6A954|nr:helix-turn-helix domain-containing protein [Pseudanabaena sp. 'Roaring Creek']